MTDGNNLSCYESTGKTDGNITRFPVTFLPMNVLAKRLKERREELGWSQAELAKRMPIPCSGSSIGTIETGETRNPRYIVEIAQTLGVSVNWLKGLTDDPTPEKITEKPIPPEHLEVLKILWDVEKENPEQGAVLRRHLMSYLQSMVDVIKAGKDKKTKE